MFASKRCAWHGALSNFGEVTGFRYRQVLPRAILVGNADWQTVPHMVHEIWLVSSRKRKPVSISKRVRALQVAPD
jgi:hypothetical protein